MANPSKRKGSGFEKLVAEYLAGYLALPVERRVLSGVNDRGDIAGIDKWVIECKATTSIDLASGMDEMERERRNAFALFGLLVVKRRMKGVERSYAVMDLEQAASLIHIELTTRGRR